VPHLVGNALHPTRIGFRFQPTNTGWIPGKRNGSKGIDDVDGSIHANNLPGASVKGSDVEDPSASEWLVLGFAMILGITRGVPIRWLFSRTVPTSVVVIFYEKRIALSETVRSLSGRRHRGA
jgi:hypothetical protein